MKRFLKQSMWYLLSSILLKATQFALLPFYTYLITPSELGTIFIVITMVDGIALLFGVSLKASIVVYTVKIKNMMKIRRFYSSVIVNTVILSLLAILMLFVFKEKIIDLLNISLFSFYCLLISSFFSFYFPLATSYLQGREEYKKLSYINIASGLVSIVCTVILVISGDSKIESYLLAFSLSYLFNFLIFIIISYKIFTRPNLNYMKLSIRFSKKLLLTDISAWIVNFSDRIMIFKISGTVQNGLYTTAYRLGQACDIIYFSINKSLTPIIFGEFKKSEPNKKTIADVYLLLIILYTLIGVFAIAMSPLLIYVVDKPYAFIVELVPIIILAYLFNAYKLIIDKPLSFFEKYTAIKSKIWLITAAVNITLNILLIPQYGALGAAYATAFSFLITIIPMYIYAQRAIHIELDKAFIIKYLVISILLVLCCQVNIPFGILFLLVYLILSGLKIRHLYRGL